MGINFQLLLITIGLQCVQNLTIRSNHLSNKFTGNDYGVKRNRTHSEMRKLLFGEQTSVQCGRQLKSLSGRVVGGREADIAEFPWQVSLQLKRRLFGSTHFCGGTVIGKRWIVTAAHCAVHLDSNNSLIVLGSTDLSPFHYQVKATIDSALVHPEYDPNTIQNDIALLYTSDPIDLSGRSHPIIPACLPEKVDEEPVGKAIVTGFGRTSESGFGGSSVLRAAEIPLMTLETCRSYYADRVYPTMLCAGFKEGKHDSCQGDSGGPLVQYRNNHGVLIGVVSWGIGCARPEKPGVYTKVASYLDWIYSTIESNQ